MPQEAGLLLQLDMTTPTGETVTVASDTSWRARITTVDVSRTTPLNQRRDLAEIFESPDSG